MTPERWQQIRDVLEKALELAPEPRVDFLNQACSSDSSLRKEVDTLLASSDHVRSNFLQSAPLPVALTPGTKLGEYEIVMLVGSGGMGEVYRARDARLGRDVAIKVLPMFFSTDADRLRRFEQEARAAAALNHPNILAVFQMGTHQGAPYLVSELLEGETLRAHLKRGRLAVRKAIDYGVQIAHGLAAAHEKGIVHRDLKPENLFVTRSGRVKILDFGLAKLTQRHASSDPGEPTRGAETEEGVVMGTVGYMAPEQVRGETADHRADIFAFGAILYEILTGTRAFQKPTSPETMTAILNEDPPSISQVTKNIPPALQRVVHRCLEKNPEQRFQSDSDLAFALDAVSYTSSDKATFALLNAARPRNSVAWMIAFATVVIFATVLVWRSWLGAKFRPARHSEIIRRQLTANAAGDPVVSSAISRDGRYLAYNGVISSKVHVLQIDTGEVREIPSSDSAQVADWFPDGAHLLVRRFGHPGIWKMSIWDGAYRKILEEPLLTHEAISPDGLHVAFTRNLQQLAMVGSDGDDPRTILTAAPGGVIEELAWSPDGKRLVYGRTRGPSGQAEATLETCDLDGGHPTTILSDRRLHGRNGMTPLLWLRDGRVLYSFGDAPNYDIWSIDVDPETGNRLGQPVTVTRWEKDMPGSLSASADGKRLVYALEHDRDVLYVADLRSGNKRPSTSRLTVDDWDSHPGDWLGDSKALLFDSWRNGKWVIVKRSLSAQNEDVLVSGTENYRYPALTPNGDRLLFTVSETPRREDSSRRLMTMPTEGGVRSALLKGAYSYHCARSPSGGCVLAEPQGQQLVFFLLDPVKGKGAEIQRVDADHTDWSLSPDGTQIALGDAEGWVRILTLANHKVTNLHTAGKWWAVQHITWAADERHVFATAWSDKTFMSQSILFLDRYGRAQIVDQVLGYGAWLDDMRASPDGRYLAYTKRSFEGNVILLENF
jgi:serine/threonine protein kinase/Tol biopolymer transport system component